MVLAAPMPEGKVSLIVTVTPDLAKKAPAGQLVKTLAPIVGGGGGGRPDFAAGGRQRLQQNYRIASGCPKGSHAPSAVVENRPDFVR